jgi:predicted nucleic acid-binding protein
VALYSEDDALHRQAKVVIKDIDERGSTVVTNFIVQEVFSVLSRVKGQTTALQFYDFITHNKAVDLIDINSHFLDQVIKFIHSRHMRKSLGLIDYSVIFFSALLECPVASFDKQLLQSAKKVGVARW